MAVAAENFPHQSDQFERSFVVNLVVHTIRLFFAAEDPLLPQNRKMLGDIALGRAAGIDDLLNAGARIAQHTEDFEPEWVSHRLDRERGLRDVLFAVNQFILHRLSLVLAAVQSRTRRASERTKRSKPAKIGGKGRVANRLALALPHHEYTLQ